MYKVNISKGYEAYPAGEVTDITEEIKKLMEAVANQGKKK